MEQCSQFVIEFIPSSSTFDGKCYAAYGRVYPESSIVTWRGLPSREDQIEQFFQGLTAMTPRDFLMQIHRIRGVPGKIMQDNAMAPLSEVTLHAPIGMTARVVTDAMDFAVTTAIDTADRRDGVRTRPHCGPP